MLKTTSINRKLIIILLIVTFLLTGSLCFGATYYIDATNGNDNNSGLSPEIPWKTIAKVNSSNFQPGDSILFKRSETWREQLRVPSSGSIQQPLVFGAYGNGKLPCISAADLKEWTLEVGAVWSASQEVDPRLVIFRDTFGTKATSLKAVNDLHEWYWDSVVKKVYIYSNTDPTNTVQIPVRSSAIHSNSKAYLTFQDLSWRGSLSGGGLQGVGDSNYVSIKRSVAELNAEDGINFGSLGRAIDYGLIEDCVCRYNGGSGILIGGVVHYWTIKGNTVHHNSIISVGSSSNIWSGGIKLWGNNSHGNGSIIENNISHSNGEATGKGSQGFGIWSDMTIGVTLRYNLAYLNRASGLFLEKTVNNSAYYNICYNNAAIIYTANIHVDANSTSDSAGNAVYNNTSYGGYWGIKVNNWQGDGNNYLKYNKIINNIAVGATSGIQLYVSADADNTGELSYGNIYEYNCFGSESAGFIQWGNISIETYNDWESAYGGPTHSIKVNPKFVNPSHNNFKLQYDSQCVNTGTYVGLAKDYSGNGIYGIPDIGAHEYSPIKELSAPKNLRLISITYNIN